MDAGKLSQIIIDKNRDLERDAQREAEGLIAAIVEQQDNITKAEARIADYRKKLQVLNVTQLDAKTILGE